MENSELLPCPFCGGEAQLGKAYPGARNVSCADCGVALPWNCKNDIAGNEGELYAIAAWNTRTQPRVTVEEVVGTLRFVLGLGDPLREQIARALKAAHPHLFKE